MATPSAASTSNTAATNPQKLSPTFAGLPTELRLQIYRIALQDIINEVMEQDAFEPGWLEYRGALALLHTDRSIRAESAREMLPIVQSEWIISGIMWQSFDDAMEDMEDDYEEDEVREIARQQRVAMGSIKAMLDKCLAGSPAAAA